MNADEIVKFDREKSDAIFTETLNDLDTLNTRDGSFEYADYVALHNDVTALYDSFSYVDELIESLTAQLAALREKAERVLCAKCKHYNKTGCSAGFGWCENMDRGTHDEFYCASGKRLEVEP